LHKLTNKECGLTFGAKAFLDGMREGSVMLFHQNTFPYGAIGVVNFLWKPSEEIKSDNMEISETRTLWMWVHPAFYQELLDELILLFNFTAVKNEADTDLNKAACHESFAENAVTSDSKISEETTALPAKKKCKPVKVSQKERKLDIEKTKLETRNIPFIRTPKYCSDNGSVKMVLLKDTLNRFRLTGPLSQAVLLESLHIANILEADPSKNKPNSEEEEKSSVADTICLQSSHVSTDDCKTGENVDWWTQFYGESQHHKQSWYYQTTLWQSLKGAASPAQLPPHLVLALTILDPRLQLPSKRTKAVPDEKG
jgi:ribonuclease P/MRP protein subunit POP1